MRAFDPLWTKAPLLLLRRFPAFFLAISAGTLLLSLAAAAGPLFVSATAGGVLANELDRMSRYGAGASVTHELPQYAVPAPLAGRPGQAGRALERALAGTDHLDRSIRTVLGPEVIAGADPATTPILILGRTDARMHVTLVDGEEQGFLLADTAARALGVAAGSELSLKRANGAGNVTVRVGGVYQALWTEPRREYWRSLSRYIYPLDPDDISRGAGPEPPPTFLVADPDEALELATDLGDTPSELRWEWPLARGQLTLERAQALAGRFDRLRKEAQRSATQIRVAPLCKGCPTFTRARVRVSAGLPLAVSEADETVARVRGPADLLSAAAVLVASVIVAAGAVFALVRRRAEVALLFARGRSPLDVGARTAIEALVPTALGTACGFALAAALVRALGPGPYDGEAVNTAVRASALALLGALVLVGIVSAVAFSRASKQGQPSRRPVRVPWEVAGLAASAYLLYRLRRDGGFAQGDDTVGRASLAVIVLPLVLTASLAGLAARALRWPLEALRRPSERLPEAAYLALRRVARAHVLARLLITGGALSFGMFVYAHTVARSLDETARARSFLFVGSDVQGWVDADDRIPAGFPLPATVVTRVPGAQIRGTEVDVLAVDPDTLAAAAHWERRWGPPLASLAEGLRDGHGSRLQTVVAGDADLDGPLAIGGTSVPITVAARTRAFPGMALSGRPLVVVARGALERVVEANGGYDPATPGAAESYVWVKGDPIEAKRLLAASPLRPFPILAAEQARENPAIRSVTETFSFLGALGLVAGALAVVGTLFYVTARQRERVVSYALARRMGLRRGTHRLALALELGWMLLVALAIGAALALLAARLIVVELDAPIELPSGPLLGTPWGILGAAAIALTVAAAAGSLLVDAYTRRASISEVIRSAN
jgi:putative ABC transport system permease protein